MPESEDSRSLEGILAALDAISRGETVELDAFLHEVQANISVPDCATKFHCRVITLDGNGACRIVDLMKYLQQTIIDYAIPRSVIAQAMADFSATKSTAKILRLAAEAKSLFAAVDNTGEGGELLLFLLGERVLGLPQLLCKMDLKTNPNVHFHGADGLHAGPGSKGRLALYWGESKLHASLGSALDSCLSSLVPILTDKHALGSRDLQLLGRYMDLNDPGLELALKTFLDPQSPSFNSVEYRGLCLVGFDSDRYPQELTSKTLEVLLTEVGEDIAPWLTKISEKSIHHGLDKFHLDLFCLPVPSVAEFRRIFRESFGGG